LNDARSRTGVDCAGRRNDKDRGAQRHESHGAQTGRLVADFAIEADYRAGQHRCAKAQKNVKVSERHHAPILEQTQRASSSEQQWRNFM
jgi:hypothetical protein